MSNEKAAGKTHDNFEMLDLNNSIALNPKEMPAKKRKLAAKVELLAKYAHSVNAFQPSKRLPELDDLALQNILTNLMIAMEKNKVLAYSRHHNSYQSTFKKYGYDYYSYDRYMKIIEGLINTEMIVSKNGFFDKLEGKGKNSRMMLTKTSINLINAPYQSVEPLDMDLFFVTEIGISRYIGDNSLVKTKRRFPSTPIVLKKNKKEYLSYEPSVETNSMEELLKEYNDFIEKHEILLPIEIWERSIRDWKPEVKLTYSIREDMHPLDPPPILGDEEELALFNSLFAFADDKDLDIYDEILTKFPEASEVIKKALALRRSKGRSSDTSELNNDRPLKYQMLEESDKETTERREWRRQGEGGEAKGRGAITGRNNINIISCKPLQCKLYRVFTRGNFINGGRFYGADYQLLPSNQRNSILIDGERVVEADYSSFHTRMLFHMKGIDYIGDPYDLYNGDKDMRAAVKLMMNIAISAPTRTKALRAFIKELKEDGENKRKIKEAIKMRKLRPTDIYNKICEVHPTVSEGFGTDSGVQLQFIDSEIASDILMYFTRKEVPCLCVHDSFIVPQQYGDELVRVMKEFYHKRLHFDPIVTYK